MKYIRVRLNPDRLDDPLVPVTVGKLSSAVFIVEGDIPDDIVALAIEVTRVGQGFENFTIAAVRSDARFRAYANPFNFPTASDALKYHIIATDESGNPRWLGTGTLRVRDNPADGSPVTPDVLPADTYIRNPVTGLYHKLTAEINEYGEVSVAVESEGIQK